MSSKAPNADVVVVRSGRSRRACGGFTLIELLIALIIAAVLAVIAMTSYAAQMRKSARAEAQATLVDAASRQQQFLVDRRRYGGSLTVLGATPPRDLASKYNFVVAALDGPPPAFTMTAQAIGDQAKDKCPTLTIDDAGNRTPPECW